MPPRPAFSVPERSVAFTERGQHGHRQTLEPGVPGRRVRVVLPTHPRLSAAPLAYPTILTESLSRRAVTTDPSDLFRVPPPDFKIRCAIHLLPEAWRLGIARPPTASLAPWGVVTMSIHKLSAGSGYDYLTRQVATLDATAKGHVGLAAYYTERGESPGTWVGSGLAGVDGLDAGDAVTADQMQALFGAGMHPLATQRLQQLGDADLTDANIEAATGLGMPFKVLNTEPGRFRLEVAKRIAGFNEQAGLLGDWLVPPTERARIHTEVARELFAAEHGRPPSRCP